MNIFTVIIFDKSDPWGEGDVRIGLFSTRERAEAAGNHATKEDDKYSYNISEQIVDQYYTENLSPLAKALEEK